MQGIIIACQKNGTHKSHEIAALFTTILCIATLSKVSIP